MRLLSIAILLPLLAACSSTEDKSLAECEKAMIAKSRSATYAMQHDTLKFVSNPDAPGEMNVSGEVIFDPGLPRASTSLFECTTRVAPGKSAPDVIKFSLVWK